MAVVIPYVKQTWVDNNASNPVSAARLGVLEEGVLDVSQAPAVRVTHNAAQSIANGTVTSLAFNTERYDQAGGVASTQHDTVTNNSRLTAIYAGIYDIKGQATFAAGAGTIRFCQVRLNGATVIEVKRWSNLSAGIMEIGCATTYSLAVNDYVEFQVFQDSGGALNVNSTGNYSPEFMMTRMA